MTDPDMKCTITSISVQAKNNNRVNVSVDGKYRFSLDVFQVGELGLKVGKQYSEQELVDLEQESQFGKLYARAIEYCFSRPHSAKEIADYLFRKTFSTRFRSRHNGEMLEKPGYSKTITDRVYQRLAEKGYVDDARFARFWVENRHVKKGVSMRKLQAELRAKGVEPGIIDEIIQNSARDEKSELAKQIEKKASRYPDRQKFMAYLARQGFSFDDIRDALQDLDE